MSSPVHANFPIASKPISFLMEDPGTTFRFRPPELFCVIGQPHRHSVPLCLALLAAVDRYKALRSTLFVDLNHGLAPVVGAVHGDYLDYNCTEVCFDHRLISAAFRRFRQHPAPASRVIRCAGAQFSRCCRSSSALQIPKLHQGAHGSSSIMPLASLPSSPWWHETSAMRSRCSARGMSVGQLLSTMLQSSSLAHSPPRSRAAIRSM